MGFCLAFYDVTHARKPSNFHMSVVSSLSIGFCIFAYLFNRADFMLVFCEIRLKSDRFLTVPLAKALKFALLVSRQFGFLQLLYGYTSFYITKLTVYENEQTKHRAIPLPQTGRVQVFPIHYSKEQNLFTYVAQLKYSK